jgi:hypothetical protein
MTPWLVAVAKAADLCFKPSRHGVRFSDPVAEPPGDGDGTDCCLLIEARDPDGTRRPENDLELEIYRSGTELNLMLTRLGEEQAPLLWQGSHPVWMEAVSGQRCDRPPDGAPHEAFCRRVRALLDPQGLG